MILFKHANILTMDGDRQLQDGFVGVRGNTIVYVGTEQPNLEEYQQVIDCTGKVLMPGLYNTHSHIPMTLLRGHGDELPLEKWLETRIYPAEDRLNPDTVKWGTLLGISEMLAGGICSYTDMYFFSDVIAQATMESGMKANISKCCICFDPEGKDDGGRLTEALELYRQYHGAAEGRIHIDMAFHAIYTTNPNYLKHSMEQIGDLNTAVQFHMSETVTEHQGALEKYGKTPAEIFAEAGVMSKPCVAAHCVQVTDSDLELLREHGVTVSTCPGSNLKLGSGIPDVRRMLQHGVRVTVGTDGCASNNNLNLWEEMLLTTLLGKGQFQDPTAVSAMEVLRMATVHGAASQQRPNCGCIREGNRADLIVVDFDRPHLIPNPNLVSNLIYSAQASDVVLNMVDGRILYQNGEYLTLDMEQIRWQARRAAEYLTDY
ncbi:MAG: amidohydrolase [Eubacteriales bacterium]|jgi:5-methylthioadenosine/S-adenosylhomocysteine deaminase